MEIGAVSLANVACIIRVAAAPALSGLVVGHVRQDVIVQSTGLGDPVAAAVHLAQGDLLELRGARNKRGGLEIKPERRSSGLVAVGWCARGLFAPHDLGGLSQPQYTVRRARGFEVPDPVAIN